MTRQDRIKRTCADADTLQDLFPTCMASLNLPLLPLEFTYLLTQNGLQSPLISSWQRHP